MVRWRNSTKATSLESWLHLFEECAIANNLPGEPDAVDLVAQHNQRPAIIISMLSGRAYGTLRLPATALEPENHFRTIGNSAQQVRARRCANQRKQSNFFARGSSRIIGNSTLKCASHYVVSARRMTILHV